MHPLRGAAHRMNGMTRQLCLYRASILSSQGRGFGFLRPIVSAVLAGRLPVRSPCCWALASQLPPCVSTPSNLSVLRRSSRLLRVTMTPSFGGFLRCCGCAGVAEKNARPFPSCCQPLRVAFPRWLQLECPGPLLCVADVVETLASPSLIPNPLRRW